MPKRKIGLQKDVSSIFKGVPLSANDQVATLRRMPILDPPGYAPAAPQQTEVPEDLATPACAGAGPAPSKVVLEPEPVVPEPSRQTYGGPAPGAIISEKPLSVEPQHQGETESAAGESIPKVPAPKKHKTALTMKAPSYAKGGMLKSLQQMKEKLFAGKPGVSQTRQKAMMVLVPALAIALVFVLTQVVSSPSRSVASDKQKAPANSATDSGGAIDWKIPAPYPATLRDPMQAGTLAPAQAKSQEPQEAEPEPEKLIVRSILHTQDRSSAVIGTQIAHEGDVILGATIVKINKDEVEFEKDGKTWTQKIEN